MLRHLQESGHAVCTCGGYHHPHRRFSPYCRHEPLASVRHALRESDMTPEAITDAIEEIAFGPGRPCRAWPFKE